MWKWNPYHPPRPGMIDIKVLDWDNALDGHIFVEFYGGRQGEDYYIIEVDERLVDRDRGVMAVFVCGDYGDGACDVRLPGESFTNGDSAIYPESKIQPWSPRVKAE